MSKEKQNTELSEKEALHIADVIRRFYFVIVKWLVLKPLVELSYIINGKMIGDVKWYQRHFNTPVSWKWIDSVTYKLTKYVMFS